MKILCIGNASYDITTPVVHFPIENTKNRVHDRVECGGGPAATAAYLLGKWKCNVAFAGVVGNDLYGSRIKKEFEEVGVNITYLEINKDVITTSAYILANRENGSRTVFTYRPSDMKLSPVDITYKPDIILIDGQEYEMSKKILTKYPNAISIIDAGRDRREVIELSRMVNYLVCSEEFAEKLSGLKFDFNDFSTLVNIFEKLEEEFKNIVVITLGSKGCLYKKDNEIKLMPSIQVKAIDSTGAGDIFHGAFTYAVAKNYEFEKALKLSCVAGAISVTRVGGRNSIPTMAEMREVYNEFR